MKRIAIFLIIFIAISVFSSGADANPAMISQPPDMAWGFDVPSFAASDWDPDGGPPGTPVAFDDFLCTDGLPITRISWWGSYYGWSDTETHSTPENSSVLGFYLAVFDNYNDGTSDMPGEPLGFNFFDIADVHETYYGEQTYMEQSGFSYHIDIPETPIEQTLNGIYWLTVIAVQDIEGEVGEGFYPWLWKSTDPVSRHGNDALVIFDDGMEEVTYDAWVDPLHPYYGFGSADLAFELTTEIPEPATMIMLGSLVTGLFGFAGIKKRFTR